jgi:hypothetical protein
VSVTKVRGTVTIQLVVYAEDNFAPKTLYQFVYSATANNAIPKKKAMVLENRNTFLWIAVCPITT